ncbi:Sensory transduction protein regX3 [Pelagimonas phthalicica]|uniref:Sensory transduction protein regX3 n=1 Tax=Pelagimonas phthalicica TaxID=1037362 RepID=A0A238J6R6_9RHOB|nr:response regulator transcription factor [Pelagimonas phthalicica]TDS95411.1 two-component system OmpR family response regulator [Pelagimonas phthalicica]SMX26065.1 Sensory transduction protein regX3 [Pelagimonas phthalicica]
MSILVVDDDARLRDLVRIALERAGYQVITASDGKIALTHALREEPELIVLDVGLPEMDGFEVCRKIRATSEVPILFLTARDDEIDRIVGLELGADDYVTKPFSPRELVARVRAILKRMGGVAQKTRHQGQITLHVEARQVEVAGANIALTGTEFSLLDLFMKSPGKMLSRAHLVAEIWGARSEVSDRTLDSHLRNLRRKLSDAGCPDAIETVHGQGIRLGPCT